MQESKTDTLFIVTLEMGGKSFVGKGETALEALQAVKAPEKFMLKGTITVKHGDKSTTRLFMPTKLRRFFYPNAQRILVKQLVMGMK